MNCRRLQNLLYEYVEGSLSADARAAADKHLAGCNACQQAVRQEQQRAQFLSDRFQQGTENLALRPEVRRRILASPRIVVGLWNRFAWPLGIAASLLMVATILVIHHFHGVRVDDPGAFFPVSIQLSYRIPTFKFRQEGNLVLDTVSEETVVVSETLWTKNPAREKQERKMPL